MADTLTTDLRFAMVPLWVLDLPLSDRAVRLYAILAGKADYGTGENAMPGRAWLADKMRTSVASVDRAIAELVDAGVVAKRARFTKRGRQRSNVFTVRRVPVGEGRTGEDPRGRTGEEGEGPTGEDHTESPIDREPKDREDQDRVGQPTLLHDPDRPPPPLSSLPALPPDRVEETFADFWVRYPRGRAGKPGGDGARKPARDRWGRMTRDERDAALAAVDHYRAYVQSPGGPIAAHATTWLNQERWEQWQEAADVQAPGSRPAPSRGAAYGAAWRAKAEEARQQQRGELG